MTPAAGDPRAEIVNRLRLLEQRGIARRFAPTSGVTIDWSDFQFLLSLLHADSPTREGRETERDVLTERIKALPTFEHGFYGVCVNKTAVLLAIGTEAPAPTDKEAR